jgi:hypothetical protein
MKASDAVGSVLVLSFGIWWVLFPASVLRFYTWFHRGEVTLPAPSGVRLAGAVCLTLVGAVLLLAFAR